LGCRWAEEGWGTGMMWYDMELEDWGGRDREQGGIGREKNG